MAPPHLRLLPTGPPFQAVYQLGASEAFRLDAASFTVQAAQSGDYVIPTLTAATPDGQVAWELAGTAAFAPARATTDPFAYSGPASFSDDDFQLVPRGYVGYALHDFGAAPVTSQLTRTWTQIDALRAESSFTWLSSPGAASMDFDIGAGAVAGSQTLTLKLYGSVAAGSYLLVHVAILSTADFDPTHTGHIVTVTDSVGGNVLDYGTFQPDIGFAATRTATPGGPWIISWVDFYRIVNPLGVGDTVTVNVPIDTLTWLGVQVNPLHGLTVGSPIGPNAGGNYVGAGTSMGSSPSTTLITVNGVPKWVGPVIFNAAYPLPLAGSLDVQYGKGLYDTAFINQVGAAGTSIYSQTRTSELHLGPLDTVTATVVDDTFTARAGDVLSAVRLWGVDDS